MQVERNLRRVATLGVVKLFNAINQQQQKFQGAVKTALPEKPGFQSMSKSSFLGILAKGGGGSSAVAAKSSSAAVKNEPLSKAAWLGEAFEPADDDQNEEDLGGALHVGFCDQKTLNTHTTDVRGRVEDEESFSD